MERKPYIVTEQAGPRVAGVKVQPGAVLMLTENQAFAELRFGNIAPKPEDKPKADKAKG